MIMKYLSDEALEKVTGGEGFLTNFLVTGINNPNGTNSVAAPYSALPGTTTAMGHVIANVGDIANLSSPYAPV